AAALCCTALCVAAQPQQERSGKHGRPAALQWGGVLSSRYAVLSAGVQVSPAGSGAVKAVEASLRSEEVKAVVTAASNAVGAGSVALEAALKAKEKAGEAKESALEAVTAATAAHKATSHAYETLNNLKTEMESAGNQETPLIPYPELNNKITDAAKKAKDAVGKTKGAHEKCIYAAGVSLEAANTAKGGAVFVELALQKIKELAETFPDAKKNVSEAGKSAALAIDEAKKASQHASAAHENANKAMEVALKASSSAFSSSDHAADATKLPVTDKKIILSSQQEVTKALPDAKVAAESAQQALQKATNALKEATTASEHAVTAATNAGTVHKIAEAIEEAVRQRKGDANKPAVHLPLPGVEPDSTLHPSGEAGSQLDPSQAADVRNNDVVARNADKHTAAAAPLAGKNGGEPKVETGSPIASPLKQSEDH
ncbi:hypothetical protein DQ04_21251000, partial [Trypanosoma grayi]|uniref:hypothetical protein n=1 Tax=Trypanosoma grayi TaxID=71804 RepID=UPI0004F453FC